jgi:predicted enzyme related to lactoylglutathione lyase
MKMWFMLTEEDKEKLARFYEQLTGMKLKPPKWDKPILCETKLEGIKEISELIKERSNYPIDVQGRE